MSENIELNHRGRLGDLTGNGSLTKVVLLELIKDYPGDTPIIIAGGGSVSKGIESGDLAGYTDHHACVFSVSRSLDAIVLEL